MDELATRRAARDGADRAAELDGVIDALTVAAGQAEEACAAAAEVFGHPAYALLRTDLTNARLATAWALATARRLAPG